MTVSALVAALDHGGALDGADHVGEAIAEGRLVRIAVWTDAARILRVRWKASTCPSLMAYAELACRLLESGAALSSLDHALRDGVAGVHPSHRRRADLVVSAARAALTPRTQRGSP